MILTHTERTISDRDDRVERRRYSWRRWFRRSCHQEKISPTPAGDDLSEHMQSSKPVKLPRAGRRLARRLKLNTEQRQLLAQLMQQLAEARAEFSERRAAEAGNWMSIFGSAQFDSEAAMSLLRGHSRWLEEKLAELIMQYSDLHARLSPAQRERLVKMLSRYFWRRW